MKPGVIISITATILLLLESSFAFNAPYYQHQQRPIRSFLSSASANNNSMEDINSRLAQLGLVLPPAGSPKANYQLLHRDGDLLYLSGHLPMKADGTLVVGLCASKDIVDGSPGSYLSTEEGYAAARHCALNLLSTLQAYMLSQGSDLSKIKVIKLFGIVRSHSEFQEQHLVMNGASDVLGDVLGKDAGGSHARSAIGTNTLPLGIPVEVEMIAKIVG